MHRETFDDKKEPDGMVVSGDIASIAGTEATLQPGTPSHEAPTKIENGHGDDDDVVMVEPVATTTGNKRKIEEEETRPVEKRLRLEEVAV